MQSFDLEKRIGFLELEAAFYSRKAVFDRHRDEIVAIKNIPAHRRTYYHISAFLYAHDPIEIKAFKAYTIFHPPAEAGTTLFNIKGTGYYDKHYKIVFHSQILQRLMDYYKDKVKYGFLIHVCFPPHRI